MDLPFTYAIDGNSNVQVRSNTKEALLAGKNAFVAFKSGDKKLAIKEAFNAGKSILNVS